MQYLCKNLSHLLYITHIFVYDYILNITAIKKCNCFCFKDFMIGRLLKVFEKSKLIKWWSY